MHYKTHFQMIRVGMQCMKSTCAHFHDKKKEEKMNARKRKNEKRNWIDVQHWMFSVQSFSKCALPSFRCGMVLEKWEKDKLIRLSGCFSSSLHWLSGGNVELVDYYILVKLPYIPSSLILIWHCNCLMGPGMLYDTVFVSMHCISFG